MSGIEADTDIWVPAETCSNRDGETLGSADGSRCEGVERAYVHGG